MAFPAVLSRAAAEKYKRVQEGPRVTAGTRVRFNGYVPNGCRGGHPPDAGVVAHLKRLLHHELRREHQRSEDNTVHVAPRETQGVPRVYMPAVKPSETSDDSIPCQCTLRAFHGQGRQFTSNYRQFTGKYPGNSQVCLRASAVDVQNAGVTLPTPRRRVFPATILSRPTPPPDSSLLHRLHPKEGSAEMMHARPMCRMTENRITQRQDVICNGLVCGMRWERRAEKIFRREHKHA
eukprot:gene10940-biopygen6325